MVDEKRIEDEKNTQKRSQILGFPYIDTSKIQAKQLYKDLLTIPELYKLRMIPINQYRGHIDFGVTNTTSQQTIKEVERRFADYVTTFSLISDAGFQEYMRLYDPPKKVEYQDIELKAAGSEELVKKVSATLNEVRANDMLAYLVQQAHKLGASDIHIENQQESTRIRFRIDGVLHPIANISHERTRMLISAVASAGNVSTSEEKSQQGHIAQKVEMADGSIVNVNLRLETVKAVFGMDVVMRLFNMRSDMYNLDRLGLNPHHRKIVNDIIQKPSGLVLAVGPTGSGKTTTLYSMLNSLNTDLRKIITIEDPVEFQFPGITQISINSKTAEESNFAERLRAVLRLDPDVIMVGEVRDLDTARTAMQASLTGHLVLSTFHASSAAAAISRLMTIIGENPLFISAIRLVMAQRLVRKLDPNSKKEYTPTEAELKYVKETLAKIKGAEQIELEQYKFYQAGSNEENPYGYKGQIAIREQFVMDSELLKLIQKGSTNTTIQEIEDAAVESGMMTMRQDGIIKVLNGETTIEEVLRVIG
ncbi:MAG: Flp pilus assembly complex ATPase component TadA [bacterium]|nr:Flp pilus assembly complex ATPase component TadA [bacterium]